MRLIGRVLLCACLLVVTASCSISGNEGDDAIKLVQETQSDFNSDPVAILQQMMAKDAVASPKTWLDYANNLARKKPNTKMQWLAEKTQEKRVYLVSFVDNEGWGTRWETNLDTKIVLHVNNSEYLSRKYGLTRYDATGSFVVSKIEDARFTGSEIKNNAFVMRDTGFRVVGRLKNNSGKIITSARLSGAIKVIYKEKTISSYNPARDVNKFEVSIDKPWLPDEERQFEIETGKIEKIYLDFKPEYVFFSIALSAEDPVGYVYEKDVFEIDIKERWWPTIGRIGLGWERREGSIYVKYIFPVGPVLRSAAIEVGDEILAVSKSGGADYVAVKGLDDEKIVALIAGDANSKVGVRLKREGRTFDVVLMRELIPFL